MPGDTAAFGRARIAKAKALAGRSQALRPWAGSPAALHGFARRIFAAFGRDVRCRTIQQVRYAFAGAEAPDSRAFVTQFFPYTIIKDHYGQFVWPENLGYVPMPESAAGDAPADDIAESARGASRRWCATAGPRSSGIRS